MYLIQSEFDLCFGPYNYVMGLPQGGCALGQP